MPGFLVGALEYLRKERPGVQPPKDQEAVARSLLRGFEIDPAMLRIAAMNLMAHSASTSEVHYHDTLASSFMKTFPTMAIGGFDVVLANPPFANRTDMSEVDPSLMEKGAATKRTELLFMTRILQMLRNGGRSATMMPLGVLSNGTNAHLALRKALINENRLEAIISLPAGVFLPYAGVATAILVFRKGGKTDHVFFARVEADGFSLNTKRAPVEVNDLPMTLARWKNGAPSRERDRTAKHFMVPAAEIEAKNFELSMGRYTGRGA